MSLLDDFRVDIGDDEGAIPSGIAPVPTSGLPLGATRTLLTDLRVDIGDDDGVIPSGALASGIPIHNLLSPQHGDTTPASPRAGDLILGANPTWNVLPSGREGFRLATISGSVQWAPIPPGVGIAVQVTDSGIAEHAAIPSAHHARYTDAEASGVASGLITTHTDDSGAHHVRYTDAEASGIAVAITTSGIANHALISGAHHDRYTNAEAIVAASGALDHHVRYTDAEASGIAVQVTTSGVDNGIANHTSLSSAHHARYTDSEAITVATGNVTLQHAYENSGAAPQIIILPTTPVSFRDNATPGRILEIQDNAGVPQHAWHREFVFMGPAVGNILSASISGISLSPALFPGRPTINLTLDQLNLIPGDRTFTSNFTKISFSSTYTLDFPAASFGAALGLNATILLRQAGGPFGMGLLFNNAVTWSNDSGFAVNLGSAFSFVDQPFYRADGATITQPVVRSMVSQPRFIVIGGGDLTLGTLQHYFAGGAINLGVHIGDRIVFDAFNPAPFTGEITSSHIALRIANLTDGGGGAAIRGVQSSMNNGLFIEQLGTAPSEHLSEFRIGSTLAHIGDTDTSLAFTTDQVDINASGVNLFRVFANGVGNFVSVNPDLNNVNFFVNGASTAGLIRTEGGIDGLGFHGATPVAQTAPYTVTSGTPLRSFNAASVTLTQLANVVAAMIADDQTKGLKG